MGHADYSEYGYGVGEVRGARKWQITQDGYLCGLFHKQKWVLGENTALCRKAISNPSRARGYYPTAAKVDSVIWAEPDEPFDPPERDHFKVHECGFYGFFDGSNDFQPTPDGLLMSGVIEGWGLVTLGPRGFRCSMARIVALLMDDPQNQAGIPGHYFGVPVFVSFERMIDEFPCEGKPEATLPDGRLREDF